MSNLTSWADGSSNRRDPAPPAPAGLDLLSTPDFKADAAARRAGFRKERDDKLKRGGCITPYPVYVAKYADGTTSRLSFWSAPGKPINFARGYNVSMLLYGEAPAAGLALVNGVPHVDPFFLPPVPQEKKPLTLKQRLAEVAELIRGERYADALALAEGM